MIIEEDFSKRVERDSGAFEQYYRLEVLAGDERGIRAVSIMMTRAEVVTVKDCYTSSVPRCEPCKPGERDARNSFYYTFNPRNGDLTSISRHTGDFREPGYRWAETRKAKYGEGSWIPQGDKSQAYESAKTIHVMITEQLKKRDVKVRDRDRLSLLKRSLENIVKMW